LETTLLVLALVLVVASILWWAHLWYWDKKLTISATYALEERLPTPDGCAIELRRVELLRAGVPLEPDTDLPPVLLVHGIGANHRNHDLHPDYSLARYLSARGRDVWLVTLRSGLRQRTRAETRLVRFANMVREDVPLAVRTVLERTGFKRLDYVGFSMGGMLLYAAIGRSLPEAQVRRAVLMGSPAVIRPPFRLPFAGRFSRLPLGFLPHVRLRLLARTSAFASEWLRTPLHDAIFNPLNVAKGVARMSLANVIEDIPGPLNYDFALWALSEKGALTLDGQSVVERLADVGVPALFFAGASDRIAPAASVRVAYDMWAANHPDVKKCFVLLGRSAGAHDDYGHGDMAMGSHVREDLFEPLAGFLESEPAACPPGPGSNGNS
ncbi:MAG TPA: alpha/beta fold hydrolase, partial [Polyangiaceae bacterium]|nr:alpha/beta fold hydrolase [Polyangiaceae bacterium]